MIINVTPKPKTDWIIKDIETIPEAQTCVTDLATMRRTFVRRLEASRTDQDRSTHRTALYNLDRDIFRARARLAGLLRNSQKV